jgi:hypothetical protein
VVGTLETGGFVCDAVFGGQCAEALVDYLSWRSCILLGIVEKRLGATTELDVLLHACFCEPFTDIGTLLSKKLISMKLLVNKGWMLMVQCI